MAAASGGGKAFLARLPALAAGREKGLIFFGKLD
jgi:hypothetical protein